ncbi:trypsin-like peptidase domain-containing protein [Shimia haliotis]|uniref:Putative peptidoglycan binding domain-containing protein n=1 Tax=Shimia haliotis TaxID=1280847 RepID=A0A1I4CLL7_9RHOB|nr:trypsin-like peptidase domain-containing protein [Shimia haliotis]SFK82164.1 Putative peptidoglycan binding domain-containing protein [Shimia haliotis]
MLRTLLSLIFSITISISAVSAQSTEDTVWVQLEAQPSLTVAQDRIRGYAATMQDVNGFSLGGGWYAVALGPYVREDAERVLQVYRAEGVIPIDSYIAVSADYRSQFWPVGANLLDGVAPAAPQITQDTQPDAVVVVEEPAPQEPEVPDETVREARSSEAALSREQKMQLQVYLQWGGYYNSGIDGAFGRGTRNSMANWQADNGFDPTGVLTTRQRDTLRGQYFAVLEGMDLRLVSDLDAGIEMQIPTGVVRKAASEYPFVRFEASSDLPATVLLISQAGDQNTLFGLYDIMQTLEVVPLNGPRERKKSSFTLVGENADIISYTQAALEDGEIKGFTLVWPAGDEERRTRILNEMKASFTRIDGTLDPAAGDDDAQSIDLIAGLQVRKPRLSRSGFFVDTRGHVVTTVEAVAACEKVTLEGEYEANVTLIDEALGIAILSPKAALAPMGVASLRSGAPRLKSEVAVSGYSYEGALGAPTMTFGQLSDVRGLGGEQELTRLALAPQPGDAGGPVFDAAGSVFGMLLPRATDTAQQLPSEVNFAVNADAIRTLLVQEGIATGTADTGTTLAPEDLTKMASGMTVLVSCW